jgi:YVTN family beta-propeller protein
MNLRNLAVLAIAAAGLYGLLGCTQNADVTNASGTPGTVSVINTKSNMLVGAPIPVGNNPQGVAVDLFGTSVYVTNCNDSTVSVIDTSSGSVTATIALPTGGYPQGIAVAPALRSQKV